VTLADTVQGVMDTLIVKMDDVVEDKGGSLSEVGKHYIVVLFAVLPHAGITSCEQDSVDRVQEQDEVLFLHVPGNGNRYSISSLNELSIGVLDVGIVFRTVLAVEVRRSRQDSDDWLSLGLGLGLGLRLGFVCELGLGLGFSLQSESVKQSRRTATIIRTLVHDRERELLVIVIVLRP